MTIDLRYGRDGLAVDLPKERVAAVLRLSHPPPLQDPELAVAESLRSPIDSAPLADLANGRKNAVVVISDITRPVPNRVLLPPILTTLTECGIRREEVLILIGGGLHRLSTEAEILEMVGPEIRQSYEILCHDGFSPDGLTNIGSTMRGTEAYINTLYVEADLRITTALIEPHLMAGFSGGRKAVVPGLAGELTMRVLHGPQMLEHPSSREGVLIGNPFHGEAVEIARMAGVDFIVNTTLNDQRQITGIFSGDLESAHTAGCEATRLGAEAQLDETVDVVVTTAAGYPLDLTFYQTVKAMTAAIPAVKPGGVILVASRCDEGVGSPPYTKLMRETSSVGEFRARMWDDERFTIDQWQLEEQCRALDHAEVWLYTEGLSHLQAGDLLVRPVESVKRGVTDALALFGPRACLAVIPDGPYVMPTLSR